MNISVIPILIGTKFQNLTFPMHLLTYTDNFSKCHRYLVDIITQCETEGSVSRPSFQGA